jgi:phage terminase large subunit-like protein
MEFKAQIADVFLDAGIHDIAAHRRYRGVFGGRGSGKSQFFATLATAYCLINSGARIVCVREVQKTLKDSVYQLLADKISQHGLGKIFGLKNDRIDTPGGGQIIFLGMQDHTAESIKSLEGYDIAWVEEAQNLSAHSLELLRPTIRKPQSELWFSWNPRSASDPVDQLLRGIEPPENAIVLRANYSDNPWFPDVLEQERLFDKKNKPDRYAHIWLGEYEPQVTGAIWTRQMLHETRRSELPPMTRIIVAVDPAVSADGDEHGIIAVGIGEDKRGYVIRDASCRGDPYKWANRAIAVYDELQADAIVIETNQGGQMVRATLNSVRNGLPIQEVHASRGKHVRAEPISALYSQGKISHVGTFPELEAQMCLMTASGYEGTGSPDRVDALVWGFTKLFPSMIEKPPVKEVSYMPMRGLSPFAM